MLLDLRTLIPKDRAVRIQYKIPVNSELRDVRRSLDVSLAKISSLDFVLKSILRKELVGGHYKPD